MADADWLKIAAQSGISLLTGVGGLFLGVWQAGKRSGKQEAELEEKIRQMLQKDTDKKIEAVRMEMRKAVAAAADNRELLVSQFHESFAGMRQKINDVELKAAETYLEKDEFKEFREEYRQDIRDVKQLINSNGHGHR